MKKSLFVALVLSLRLLSPDAVHACVCGTGGARQLSPEEFREVMVKEFEKASVIFTGEVVELDEFRATFRVEKLWKGDSDGSITLLTGAKDTGDGRYIHRSSCDFRYELGERLLVYAYGPAGKLMVHRCSRTRSVGSAEVDMRALDVIKPYEIKNPAAVGGHP